MQMTEICSHNVQCVCAYQQEEFLRPHPDTLSDLTAMPRANQHVHINMNTHQHECTPKYHHNAPKPIKKETIWFDKILPNEHIFIASYPHIFLSSYSPYLIFSYPDILIFLYSHILLTSYPRNTDMAAAEISCVHIGGCQPR